MNRKFIQRCAARTTLMVLAGMVLISAYVMAQDFAALDEANEALRTGEYREVRRLYRPLLDTVTGDRREEITGYFETYLATGEYEDGFAEVEEYLAESPDDPFYLHMKGRFHEVKGQYQEALDAYVAAFEHDDGYVRNLLTVGGLFDKAGRNREAQSVYQLVVQEYRQNQLRTARTVAVAAEAYARLGDFHEANDVFRIAYELDPRDTQTLYWWGDLFREKYNTADARRTFEEAMAVNPKSADLLIGYARSYESLARWEMLADQALEVNPNATGATNILAQIAILDGDYLHAQELLTEALTINPVDELTLANLASVYHLRGETESFEQVELVAQTTNPRCGDFYVTIAENCVYRYRYADAVEFCRQAVARETDNWRAYALLGTNVLRLGQVEEARRALERAYAGDPFDIFARNSLELLDDYEDFDTAESEHFTLLIHESESEVLARPILELAEECYDSLSTRYSYRPEQKIRLEAYHDHDDFAVRISGLPGIGLLGVCFGDVVAFDTPRAQSGDDYNWAVTLWHEIGHVMALGISDNRVPRWFTEGLSVYEESQGRPAWGRETELELFIALDRDLLLPLAELNQGFTRPTYDEQVIVTYYQSAKVIEYIVTHYGFGVITDMLAEFRHSNWEAVFPVVLGVTVDQLNDAFFDDMREKRRAYNRLMIDPPPMLSVQRDEQGDEPQERTNNPFFRALADGRDLLAEDKLEEAEEKYLEALDIYDQYTLVGNPYLGLAEVYRRGENDRKLIDILERYLEVTEYGASEARELAELLDNAGDTARAAQYYHRSMEVAPYDIDAHTRLAELYHTQERYGDEIRERRIVLALNPLDRARAHYHLALSLFNSDQVPDARREVLRSLELAPGYREAQELLLACVEE